MEQTNILKFLAGGPHNIESIVASSNAETRPGLVDSTAPVKPKAHPVRLDGQKTKSRFVEGLYKAQIQNYTPIDGTDQLAEWCRQLPALQLRNGKLCLISGIER